MCRESVMKSPATVMNPNKNTSLKEPLIEFDEGKKNGLLVIKYGKEVRMQCVMAAPMIIAGLLQFSMQLISLMFVGHLDKLSLSGVSLAVSLANVTGFQILLGMSTALETLCGQAYGAKQYQIIGILLQRAIFTLLFVSLPVSMVWIYMEDILLALGQDLSIASKAGNCTRWMSPALFAYAFLQPLAKFLQAQSIVMPIMISSAIVSVLHAPLCWLLVFKVGFGVKGAALAIDISYGLNAILLLLYVLFSPTCKKTRSPISREALHGVQEFLKISIPSAAMLCFEYWCFELIVLLSGILPNPQLEMSVLSICLNTNSLAYTISFGLGAAASTRVANEIGASRTEGARVAVKTVIGLSLLDATVVGSIFICVRNIWGLIYSNDQEVIQNIAHLMPILAVASVVDCLQGVLSGILRGFGWQNLGAWANLIAYYVVGLPAAAILAFVFHLGGKGLWIGITMGLMTQTILLLVLTFYSHRKEHEVKPKEKLYAPILPLVDDRISKDLQ